MGTMIRLGRASQIVTCVELTGYSSVTVGLLMRSRVSINAGWAYDFHFFFLLNGERIPLQVRASCDRRDRRSLQVGFQPIWEQVTDLEQAARDGVLELLIVHHFRGAFHTHRVWVEAPGEGVLSAC